jgi:type IV secretory pathway VirB10-like protein
MYYPPGPPPQRPKLAHEQLWEWFQRRSRSGKIMVCCVVLFLTLSCCMCSTTAHTSNQTVAQPTVVVTVLVTRQSEQQTVPTLQPTPTPSPTATLVPTPTDTPTPVPTPQPTEAPAQPALPVQAPSTGERTGAVCNDGTTSMATGSGACSHHHGVNHWLYN